MTYHLHRREARASVRVIRTLEDLTDDQLREFRSVVLSRRERALRAGRTDLPLDRLRGLVSIEHHCRLELPY